MGNNPAVRSITIPKGSRSTHAVRLLPPYLRLFSMFIWMPVCGCPFFSLSVLGVSVCIRNFFRGSIYVNLC